jgi:uncharacterized protein (TIGR00106 family)
MLFELSVIPLGGDVHLSEELADVLAVVHASGLPYKLGPTSTCIEGEWERVMPTVQACHQAARRHTTHVITLIKVEDDAGERNKIRANVDSVESKVGRNLERVAEDAAPAAAPNARTVPESPTR